MTFFHTIESSHGRQKLLLISFKEDVVFPLFSLKTNLIAYASFFKNTVLGTQNGIEVRCSH